MKLTVKFVKSFCERPLTFWALTDGVIVLETGFFTSKEKLKKQTKMVRKKLLSLLLVDQMLKQSFSTPKMVLKRLSLVVHVLQTDVWLQWLKHFNNNFGVVEGFDDNSPRLH